MVVLVGNLHANPDTWTGGGADNNWMTSGNWGGTAPSANDNLIFSGTTRLSPSNNFTAGTNFDGITFSSTSGTFTLSGNAIDLTGNITNNSSNAEIVGIGLVLQGPSTFTTTSNTTAAASTTFSGNISGTGPLSIIGSNAVGTSTVQTALATTTTLSGSNSYSGSTTLAGGNISLNYSISTASKLSGSTLTLGGSAGGVALTTSGGTGTETVSSTVIAAGNSSLAPATNDILNLGTVSSTDGGVLILSTKSASQVINYGGTITATSNVGGILGGFAIFSGQSSNTDANWVASTGTTSSPSTLSIFTGYNTSTTTSTWANTNVSMAAAQNSTLASAGTINSLKFAGAGATLNLSGANVITSGGILSPSGYGGTITGGSITSSGADLNIFASSSTGTVAIASNIVGNIGITMAPSSANSPATLLLTGSANTFTGNIAVTRGILALGSALPSNTGDTITLNTVVNSGSGTNSTILQDAETAGTLTINAANYQIVGNGNVTKNNQTGNTFALLGAHAYTGITTDSGGVLQIDTLANGGSNSSIGASSNAASNLVLAGGATLQYIGSGGSTDHLFTISGSTGTVTLDSSGTGAADFINTGSVAFSSTNATGTLILTGTNTGANTLAAAYGNQGTGTSTLSKTGVGTWILSGSNTYSGGTTVNAGTLGVTGSLASSGSLAVVSSAGGNANFALGEAAGGASPLSQTVSTLSLTSAGGKEAILSFNLSGASYDSLTSNGALTLSGSTFELNLNGASTGTDNLLTWLISGSTGLTSTANVDLVLNGIDLGTNNPYLSIVQNGTGATATDILELSAIPEPSTWAMMVGGLAVLLVWQRRKARRS